MDYVYEKAEVMGQGAMILVMMLLFVLFMLMIRNMQRQYSGLKAFRKSLERGDLVRVRGMSEDQQFWTDKGNGKAVVRVFGSHYQYRTVLITDIFPPKTEEEGVEYEIIHK